MTDPWRRAGIERGIAETRRVLAAEATAFDLAAWLDRLDWWNSEFRRAATPLYQRFDAHARQLTVARIMAARDLAAVERLELVLRRDRWDSVAWRTLTRAQLPMGGLIAAATNRARMLRLGRIEPKVRVRFDLARIPDDRLAWLIQRHADVDLVDRLRDERRRRDHARA